MKSEVFQLRERFKARVNVVRVDFNSNLPLVSKLGGTICLTYVLYVKGKPILTRSFPVSIEMLESEIDRHFASDSN